MESVIVPAGRYYLSDPCYAVPDHLWNEVLTKSDYFETPFVYLNDSPVLGFSTQWGDGVYYDQYGNEFGVDAGLIGLVHEDLVTEPYGGVWVVFNEDTICTSRNGLLTFGEYRIDTDPREEIED